MMFKLACAPWIEPVAALRAYWNRARHTTACSFVFTQQERFGCQMGPRIRSRASIDGERIQVKVLEGPSVGKEYMTAPELRGKCRVRRGRFPDLTLTLDPQGAFVMTDQHHPVYDVGFRNIASILERSTAAAGGMSAVSVALDSYEDEPYVRLIVDFPVEMHSHTVEDGDTAWTLAHRHDVNAYLLVHVNQRKSFEDFRPGDRVLIPQTYASRVVLELFRETALPHSFQAYDHEGELYEHYEWSDIEVHEHGGFGARQAAR